MPLLVVFLKVYFLLALNYGSLELSGRWLLDSYFERYYYLCWGLSSQFTSLLNLSFFSVNIADNTFGLSGGEGLKLF